MDYVFQPYPSRRYHRSGATQLVHNDEQHEELHDHPDWSDTPATFLNEEAADETPAGGDAPAAPKKARAPKKPKAVSAE